MATATATVCSNGIWFLTSSSVNSLLLHSASLPCAYALIARQTITLVSKCGQHSCIMWASFCLGKWEDECLEIAHSVPQTTVATDLRTKQSRLLVWAIHYLWRGRGWSLLPGISLCKAYSMYALIFINNWSKMLIRFLCSTGNIQRCHFFTKRYHYEGEIRLPPLL